MNDVRFGLNEWVNYFKDVAALPITPKGEDPAEALVASGLAVIGTPDDAIAQIKRLEAESGGFGTFLHMAHNWADWAETKRSYALFSRYVAPEFQHRNDNRRASYEWAAENHTQHIPKMEQAIDIKNTKGKAEKATKQ